MRYRGGGSGSAPSPVCVEDEWRHTHRKKRKNPTHIVATHLSHSRMTSPAALFMTTLDDMAPEEQVVHNVIPLKDKMPLLGFSDVHCKAKSSLTVTFVRCQSDASHTDVQLLTAGLLKTPLPLIPSVRAIMLERWRIFSCDFRSWERQALAPIKHWRPLRVF